MQNRSVAAVIILTIITCGIYGLYWVYVTADGLERDGQTGQLPAIAQLLLVMFLGGIGYIFVGIAADKNINAVKASRGLPTTDNMVVYILVAIFIPIVLIGIIQNEINKLTVQG